VNFMSELFILQNQDKLFLGRQKEWLDGRDSGSLFKTPYKDEAVNQMFEVSSKDYTQRIKILGCAVSEKGLPVIDAELMPPPQPKPPKPAADKRAASVEEVTGLAEAEDEDNAGAADFSLDETEGEPDAEADKAQQYLL
jgi:hypothetical protein